MASEHIFLNQWARHHAGCKCSRFSDFSFSRGKELVSKINGTVSRSLGSVLPPVTWQGDADVHATAACQAGPGIDAIRLAKGSCVNWTTTLVAYVHALSHVLTDEKLETGERHGIKWQQSVTLIASSLTSQNGGMDARHFGCIRESLCFLKNHPTSAEWFLSCPTFLRQHEMTCGHVSFTLAYTIDDETVQRRKDANEGNVRWRFQDEFDSTDLTMQQNGHVAQGSLVEWALQLKQDHDPRCRCCSHEAYDPSGARELAKCIADEILPLHLPVVFSEEPMVTFVLSSRPNRSFVDNRDVFRVNLNRVETFAEVVRVVVREWARRFVGTEGGTGEGVQSYDEYFRAVAGFSTLFIGAFPFDGLLRNWFPSRDCLCMALVPAPKWSNTMIPLMRVNRHGAEKVLRERTFDDLSSSDLDESRESATIVRESAMHAGLEDTCDFKDYQDFLTIRGPTLRESLSRPSLNGTFEFRVRSVKLNVSRNTTFRGNASIVEMTDEVVNLLSQMANVPDDPSLFQVRFNDESEDLFCYAADVAKRGLDIRVEPIMREVQVLKEWTLEIVLQTEVPSTFTASDLLELIQIENFTPACIVQQEMYILKPMDIIDTRAHLRVFEEGYVSLLACVSVGRREVRDHIVVEVSRVDEPLENLLARWRLVYGIQGDIECEGCPVDSLTTVSELASLEHVRGDTPLRVRATTEPAERDIPVYKIAILNTLGNKIKEIKLKSHQTLENSFEKVCKIAGILPQAAQLTDIDGKPVEPQQRIFGLGLDKVRTAALVLTRKAPPKPSRRKRVITSRLGEHGTQEKQRLGKFAHPRPSVSCIVISSDSEDETTDERDE